MRNDIINGIIEVEGGYSHNPSDSGGETMYGITKHVAGLAGYIGPMSLLPRDLAFTIYTEKYWDSLHGDTMLELSAAVTEEVVDTGVNMGVSRAAKFLQRCLNIFNRSGALYPDVTVDGNVGPATLSALNGCLTTRGEAVLVKALNCLQGAFYVELAERREKDEEFIYGWFNNRVKL